MSKNFNPNDDDGLEKVRGLTPRESHSTLFNSETSTIHSNDHLLQSVISRTSSPTPLNDYINNTNLLQTNLSSEPSKIANERSLPMLIEPTSIPNNNDKIHIHNIQNGDVDEIHKDWSSPPPTYEDLKINDKNDKEKKSSVEDTADHTIIRIDVTEDQHKPILQTDKNIRMAFVRKVYAILTTQLLITIGISVWFMTHKPTQEIIKDYQWTFFVMWILAFITLVFLFWQRKRHPFNMILLILFTLFLSCGVASVVILYSSKVVLQSFMITFGVFVALELFTLQTKIDFSSWGPFLYAGIWVIISAGFIGWIFPFDKYYYVFIGGIAALLFSAYIIYDTYMILNRVSPEEYIMASVDLYLDIINLFVAMLAILTGTTDK